MLIGAKHTVLARRHNEQIRKTQIIGVATQRKTKKPNKASSAQIQKLMHNHPKQHKVCCLPQGKQLRA